MFFLFSQSGFASNDTSLNVLKAVKAKKWQEARSLALNSQDPLTQKLYFWIAFQNSTKEKPLSDLVVLQHFIERNPHWPKQKTLQQNVERLLPSSTPPAKTLEWFREYPPQTTGGVDHYISALLKTGSKGKARQYLEEWWANTPLPRADQKAIFKKYAHLLDNNAHIKRLDVLLLNGQYSNARAIARLLGKSYVALAEARIALAQNKGKVESKIAAIPDWLKKDAGLQYERLRWRRKRNLNSGMEEILNNPPEASDIRNPGDWWKERHILIRRHMEQGNFKKAYQLARHHQQTEGFSYAQAEWLTGWLALRFMDKPTIALDRFQKLHDGVKTPISKTRAAYWAGKAAQSVGNNSLADKWLKDASKTQTVYYGQLAAIETGASKKLSTIVPPIITHEERKQFRNNELIKAADFMRQAGFQDETLLFLRAFINQQNTPKSYLFAAETASQWKRYKDAVRIAKDATKNGMFLTAQSYPLVTHILSSATRGHRVEWALIHSLIRQESQFDQDAKSPAGALGLMQLMPATARLVARQNGQHYRKASLTQNPSYNVKLGTAYLEDMLNRYNRSYPMAIAAYNAGPGRVDKWLKIFGDPRTEQISMVDWIELIPIYETRNYVQRVTEGLYVYRLRLDGFKY